MFYRKDRGFTLVEMLIVIIIIGILAALGFPQFGKTKEHALGKEAIANLKLIAAAEKIYRMEAVTSYYPSLGIVNNISTINTNLKLSLPSGTTRNWDYSITGGAATFTAIAARLGKGGYLDCQYSINQGQDDPVPKVSSSCP